MNTVEILKKIKQTESPLKRQLLMVALITKLLEQKGKDAPIVIGGVCFIILLKGGLFYRRY